jgi:hypothetical protein
MFRSTLVALLLIFTLQPATAAIFERDGRFAANANLDPAVRAIGRHISGRAKALPSLSIAATQQPRNTS